MFLPDWVYVVGFILYIGCPILGYVIGPEKES